MTCCFKFFKKYEDKIDELEAISNDYYKEIDLKFILSEYTRTGIEIEELQDLAKQKEEQQNTVSGNNAAKAKINSLQINVQIKRLLDKKIFLGNYIEDLYFELMEFLEKEKEAEKKKPQK